jgi:hypothetical protein
MSPLIVRLGSALVLCAGALLLSAADVTPNGRVNKVGETGGGETPQWLQDYEAQSQKVGKDWQSFNAWLEARERLRPHWADYEALLNAKFAEICAPGITSKDLAPKTIYEGHIDGWAVSSNGVAALADLSKREVIIFPDGLDKNVRHTPLEHNAFSEGSVGISSDGRYVSWADGWADYIYDVSKDTIAWKLDDMEGYISEQQWVGDDLLILEPRKNTLLLVKSSREGFRESILTSTLEPSNVIDPIASGLVAVSDQFGLSFLRGEKAYSKVTDAIADGAVIEIRGMSGNVYRTGNRLLRLTVQDPYERAHNLNPPTLELHDGASGAKLLVRPVEPACEPRNIAATGDNASFALLVGPETVLIKSKDDLVVGGAYNLRAPAGSMATPDAIRFLGDGRIVVGADESISKKWLLVYSPHTN